MEYENGERKSRPNQLLYLILPENSGSRAVACTEVMYDIFHNKPFFIKTKINDFLSTGVPFIYL